MPTTHTVAVTFNEAQLKRLDEMIAQYNNTRDPQWQKPIETVEQLIAGGLVTFEALVFGITDPSYVSPFEERDTTPKKLHASDTW